MTSASKAEPLPHPEYSEGGEGLTCNSVLSGAVGDVTPHRRIRPGHRVQSNLNRTVNSLRVIGVLALLLFIGSMVSAEESAWGFPPIVELPPAGRTT